MPKYYPKPEFSRMEVNKAGETLINENATPEQKDHALTVINNWRVSHNFPLNTFQMRLRKVAKRINRENLVAQRIKRLPSIKLKLELQPHMKMSQMQDIGGCRAIVKNIKELNELVSIYKHESRGIKHKPHKEQDYIEKPKLSGYRGVHLVYKYGSDKSIDYLDMRIEIQIRTLMQHAWATAVETVDTFRGTQLKSGQGDRDWTRFFVLMGSAMAIFEGKPVVPGTSENMEELRLEIIELEIKLNVEEQLKTFKESISVIDDFNKGTRSYYYLMTLDATGKWTSIKGYQQNQLNVASSDYMTMEKRYPNGNVNAVLVAAESIDALKLAYPNYYLDTEVFLEQLKRVKETTPTAQLSLW